MARLFHTQNSFTAIAGEPGQGQMFYFDNQTVQNTLLGTDNCPSGPVSDDPSFIFISAGSVYGGANGPGQSAVAGESGNTVSAHRIVCGNITATPPLGGFRGGVDLCAAAAAATSGGASAASSSSTGREQQEGEEEEEEEETGTAGVSVAASVRGKEEEVAALRAEVAELRAMVMQLLSRDR
jgi:hypothetical protein